MRIATIIYKLCKINPIIVLSLPEKAFGKIIDKNKNAKQRKIPLYKLHAALSLFL